MPNPTPIESIEEKFRAATRVPEPRVEFLASLRQRFGEEPRPAISFGQRLEMTFRKPAWSIAAGLLIILTAIFFIIGPQNVVTAMGRLFVYISGVGIVEQSTQFRVLSEPVRLTRDGVTVSVNRAFLTVDQTRIDSGISGVPLSAYPMGESLSGGCMESEYLRLPDGTKLAVYDPVPLGVKTATFVMPCIFGTLPGSVPQDWELTLSFIPAPADLTALPVIELSPSPLAAKTATLPAPLVNGPAPVSPTNPDITTATPPLEPTQGARVDVTVDKVIETADGYILIGAFHPQVLQGAWVEVTGIPQIRDANGQRVMYTFPQDIELPALSDASLGGFNWRFQFQSAGLSYPLSIQFTGRLVSPIAPQETAEIDFDAGENPQPDQEWSINQDVTLAGFTFRLVSIRSIENGYSFLIGMDRHMSSVNVQIAGFTPAGREGGGGGDAAGVDMRTIHSSLVYPQQPTGKLKIIFSNPLHAGETQTWEGQWQPASPHSSLPAQTANPYPVCVNAATYPTLPPLPAGLEGKALLTELQPELSIVLANLDGSQRQVLAPQAGRGALSPDGNRLAFPSLEGIRILDIATGTNTVLWSAGGYDLHWSPDGSQIALVNPEGTFGIFVANVDGSNQRQLTNLGYESIAGWSPDGKQLYYAIPDSSGKGWLLKAIEIASGEERNLFILEDSSRKAPMPAVSPDGQWIAYRDSDNSSLYLIRMDGTQRHVVLEKPIVGTAINGIAWGPDGHLLAVSLTPAEDQDGGVLLIQPEGCETYRLSGVHGEVDGLLIH